MDVGWGWTVVLFFSSVFPNSKEDPSTKRAKLMHFTRLQQGSPLGIRIRISIYSNRPSLCIYLFYEKKVEQRTKFSVFADHE